MEIKLVRKYKIRDPSGDVYMMNEFSNGERACYLHRKGSLTSAVEMYSALGSPGDLNRIHGDLARTAESIRTSPGTYSDWDWEEVKEESRRIGESARGVIDLLTNAWKYAKESREGLVPRLSTAALVCALAAASCRGPQYVHDRAFVDKAHTINVITDPKTSFLDEMGIRLYSERDDELNGNSILKAESRSLDLGVEYDGDTKALGANLKLPPYGIRAVFEENGDQGYEIKLRRKLLEGLHAAVGGGKVNGKPLAIAGLDYKDLENPDFDWGVDGGYIKLNDEDKIRGDGWVSIKDVVGREVFFGARYDEADNKFLVFSLPSDDEWALRFLNIENSPFSKSQLIFTTRARPGYMSESDSYYLLDVDFLNNTSSYIRNPLRYIVPKFHHQGQGSEDKVELVAAAELTGNKGSKTLKGEMDVYLNPNLWAGLSGEHDLGSGRTTIGIPFGIFLSLGEKSPFQMRLEPRYNLDEGKLSGSVMLDATYRF